MATRLYLAGSNTQYDGGTAPSAALANWNASGASFFVGGLGGHHRNAAVGTLTVATGSVDPRSTCAFACISPTLRHQTIASGTIKGQFRCNEATAADDAQLAFALTIVKPDGTLRSIWLDVSANAENATTEMATTLTNRKLRDASGNVSISLPSVAVEAGDRIMLEVGVKAYSTTNATISIGIGQTGTPTSNYIDLPEDDTATTADYLSWIELSQDIQFEFPFYMRSASIPALDSASATNATATLTITPPTTMRQGDLVVVQCQSRNSTTWSIGVAGGQTWTSETAFDRGGGADNFCRVFWCTFNGTWSASPRFDTTSSTCTSAVMNVFRGRTTSESWVQDVAQTTSDLAAAATLSVPAVATTANAKYKVVLASIATADDNTWANPGASGNTSGAPRATDMQQYRNTSGSDQSMAFGHYLAFTGGAETTSTFDFTVTANGNDAGKAWSMAWRAVDLTDISEIYMPTMRPPANHLRRI